LFRLEPDIVTHAPEHRDYGRLPPVRAFIFEVKVVALNAVGVVREARVHESELRVSFPGAGSLAFPEHGVFMLSFSFPLGDEEVLNQNRDGVMFRLPFILRNVKEAVQVGSDLGKNGLSLFAIP